MDIQNQTKSTIPSDDGVENKETPDATKLLDTPIEVSKPHDNLEILKTLDTGTEDRDGSHKHNFINTFEVSDNKDQGDEVYVLSVPRLVDHADTLLDEFKDHKTIYSTIPRDDKGAENRYIADSFEVKTVQENIEESQTSEKSKSVPEHTSLDLVFAEEAKVAETQTLEMSEIISKFTGNLSEPEASSDERLVVTLGEKIETEGDSGEINREKFESHHKHAQEVIKEPESGIKEKQKIVESIVADSKDSGNIAISERLEKAGVISETVVDESIGSSSRNSVEGNWGSVSVLSTASVDAENSQSIGKSDVSMDKSRLGKSYALVESKEEFVDQKSSETMQISQPPKPEANISNETEGRKRNEEAIAKVTNWSTGAVPLKNLVTEAKSSNPKQLPTMIQNEVIEKASDPEKSNLTSGTPPVNQDPSPPKYIGDDKKVGKKNKGRASWVPFVCCSSVNVN